MALFSFEDAFNVTGRGLVLTGRIEEGNINRGDFVFLPDKRLEIVGIEMFRKAFNTAQPGDNVGLLVRGNITKEEVNEYRKQKLSVMSINEIRDKKLKDIGI